MARNIISSDEWRDIERIIEFLAPFEELSTKMGAEKYSTLPYVVPAFNLLLDVLEDLIEPSMFSEQGLMTLEDAYPDETVSNETESDSGCESESEVSESTHEFRKAVS